MQKFIMIIMALSILTTVSIFEISELVISTCTSCDPLSTTTSPTALLAEFNAWVQAGGFEHTFNGAHFGLIETLLVPQ